MKNKKLLLKILFDLIMLIVFILLLRKMNFGIAFHEIAGLAVLGAFLLHLVLNRRWICNITKRFFSRDMSFRVRLSWILNFALLICFAVIGISGVFISKVLFDFSVAGNWKTLHYFFTALAMILLGVHIGLHATMIGGVTKNALHLPQKFAKVLCICLTLAMVGLGTYSAASDSFGHWLTMPFQMQDGMSRGAHPAFEQNGELNSEQNMAQNEQSSKYTDQNKNSGSAQDINGNENEMTGHEQEGEFKHQNGERMQNMGNPKEMGGMQKGGVGISNVLWNSLKGFSIIYLFAAVTALLSIIVKKFKCRELPR